MLTDRARRQTRAEETIGETNAAGPLSGAGRLKTLRLLDEGLNPVLREVDDEREADRVHEPMDFGPLALEQLDQDPRDEAGADADRDVVGERHEDDGQESRQAVFDRSEERRVG